MTTGCFGWLGACSIRCWTALGRDQSRHTGSGARAELRGGVPQRTSQHASGQ
jgi:hypothetical protein